MIDYASLSNALHHFSRKSYASEFEAESACLYCRRLDLRVTPEEFDVVDVHRFDETASRKGEHLLYLISSLAGIRGTLVLAAEDVYLENMTFEMAQKLRIHPYGEWICS